MKISLLTIKKIIVEEIGRDYKSVNDMPMDYTRYPEIDVTVDFITEKGKWMAGVKTRNQKRKVYRYFNSQDDAQNWARNEADRVRTMLMNKAGYDAVHLVRQPYTGKAPIKGAI